MSDLTLKGNWTELEAEIAHGAFAAGQAAARAELQPVIDALEPHFGRNGDLHPPLEIRNEGSLREIDRSIREALAAIPREAKETT